MASERYVDDKIKILFFIESLRAGGKERRLVELLKELNKDLNFEIELVLTKSEIHYNAIHKLNIKIHLIERRYIKKDPRLFYQFYQICRDFKPDIIHSWGAMVTLYAVPAKILLKIPLLNNQITDAAPIFTRYLFFNKINFFFSNLIIANSKAGLKTYKPPAYKSTFIYNGFDFSRISILNDKIEIRNKFKISTKYLVGMVASYSNRKDYLTFINSSLKILKERDDISFICAGSGDKKNYLKMIPANFSDKILLLDKQENVESIMNACDIGVLMSNNDEHGEGISNALMEFMSLSKPVICNDSGGNNELVIDGKTGFIIAPKNSQALVEKIKFLIDDENFRAQLGEHSKRRIMNEFNIERMVTNFKKIYFDQMKLN